MSHSRGVARGAIRARGSVASRRRIAASIMVIAALFFSASLMLDPADAAVKRCAPVVKKIYFNEGFYKAKVLIVSGNVDCAEARRIIWRALSPGGFNGGLAGWQCESKGNGDPLSEKCKKEDPRRVIKSNQPKLCPNCHANRK